MCVVIAFVVAGFPDGSGAGCSRWAVVVLMIEFCKAFRREDRFELDHEVVYSLPKTARDSAMRYNHYHRCSSGE